jgi:hypothetical protein
MSIDNLVDLSVLNQVEKNLRRYTLESKLEMFRKLNHVVNWHIPNENFLKIMFPNKTPLFYTNFPRSCFVHELAFLSLISTVAGEWNGQLKNLSSYKELKAILNLNKSYVPPLVHERDEGVEDGTRIRLFLVRTALQQFIYQDSPISGIYRYWYMFNFTNANFSAKQKFKDLFKFEFADYVKFCSGVYLLSNVSLENLTIQTISREIGKSNKFSKDKIEFMINNLSMNRQTAIKKYHEYKSQDERMKIYNYNPYLMKPILREEGNLYLPIPLLLFKAITEGFYHMLCYTFKEFRALFGKYPYEEYIGHLLKDRDFKVIKEFDYYEKKQELKSSDYIIVKDNHVIFIELKANAPSIALRDSDLKIYKNELNKAYVEGIIQCIKKKKHIESGLLQHKDLPNQINRFSFLVVSLEEYFFIDHELITSMLKERGYGLEGVDYHIMGTPTLEAILEQDSRELFQFIQDRENNKTVYSFIASTQVNNKNKMNTNSFLLWERFINELSNELFGMDIKT